MKILMVENHAVFARTVIGQFLGDHEVDVVPTLAVAQTALGSQRYEVVLVDYDLDDGKGDAFVRMLAATHFPGAIIAMSSHDEGNRALVGAGATAVCPKTKFHTIGEVLARAIAPCPCCLQGPLSVPGGYDICTVCGWEDDPVQSNDPDYEGGANRTSLRAARAHYARTGSAEPDRKV